MQMQKLLLDRLKMAIGIVVTIYPSAE